MIAAILVITLPIFLAGAGLILLAGRKQARDRRRNLWLKYAVYALLVHAILVTIVAGWFAALVALILAAGAVELGRALAHIQGAALRVAIGMAYLLLAAALVFAAVSLPQNLLVFMYLLVAGFDGFCEIFGRLLGRIKLARTISPGKTVEGAVAGGAGALVLALAAAPIAGVTPFVSAAVGAGICISALLGDLAASWVKRRAGIKDFSGVIPGHGGVLDRFDSLIGTGAVAGAVLFVR